MIKNGDVVIDFLRKYYDNPYKIYGNEIELARAMRKLKIILEWYFSPELKPRDSIKINMLEERINFIQNEEAVLETKKANVILRVRKTGNTQEFN